MCAARDLKRSNPQCSPLLDGRVKAAHGIADVADRVTNRYQAVRPALTSQICSQVEDALCKFSRGSCEAW
jgi:hypothetical protein